MKFQIYKDVTGEWRFRMVAGNNEIIGVCSEGYKHRRSCIDTVRVIQKDAAMAVVEEIT